MFVHEQRMSTYVEEEYALQITHDDQSEGRHRGRGNSRGRGWGKGK